MTNSDFAYINSGKTVAKDVHEEIRQVQLEVNRILETPSDTTYGEEYRRLLNKCGKVLSERFNDPQLSIFEL